VYWYNDGGVISLSQHKRSRFIVTVQTRHQAPKIPIIAKDKVEVQWVGVDSTRALDVSKGFLALSLGETEVLYFSDFLQRFSIVFSDSAQPGDPYADSKISWSSESGKDNDSFELCDGVPVGELGDMDDY
jgi:hypothetical protein